jgi:hypothetical protein
MYVCMYVFYRDYIPLHMYIDALCFSQLMKLVNNVVGEHIFLWGNFAA